MKDLNWEQRDCKLQFGPGKSNILMEQLRADVQVKQPSISKVVERHHVINIGIML